MKVYEALEQIKRNVAEKPIIGGICYAMFKHRHTAPALIWNINKTECFEDWNLFSNDYRYPVPHPEATPRTAYIYKHENMWDKDNEYGRNRWALLDHCIDWFKARDL